MKIGEFFTLAELTKTDQPFKNEPELWQVVNLTRLTVLVLDPLRLIAGPLNVTSGYRSERVNTAVGGVTNSFHLKGLAADIWSDTRSPRELAGMLGGLEFDKAIVYPKREFMHVQIAPIGSMPRGEILEKWRSGYRTL